MERRVFGLTELRAEGDGEGRTLKGYAAVFNQLSEPMWGMREKIRPGAFAKTLGEADIRAVWNHNADYVLGRTKTGSLTLREDERGLWVEIKPPGTTWANDFVESIRRGDVDQMSFGFETVRDFWEGEEGQQIRTLVEVKLYEVSPVTFPAYPQTEVSLRALEEQLGRLRTADPEQARALIARLSTQFAPAAPPDDGHPEGEEAMWRLGLLKRRLDLALV